MKERSGLRGLYAITPEHPSVPHGRVKQVELALGGGARLVQYRDKGADQARRLEEARGMLAACRRAGALFIVNDDVDLARAVGADGVHLGRDDMTFAEARHRLGDGALIGLSCYSDLARAEQAVALGADYLAFGRFFPSRTKPAAVQADPGLLREARRRWPLPLVAIGGISPQNGGPLIEAGAHMLAVVDALFGAPDVAAAAAALAALFDRPPRPLSSD